MKTGNYKVCQKCLGRIVRNGIIIYLKVGTGFRKKGKYFHKYCWKEVKQGFNHPIHLSYWQRLRMMMGYVV